MLLNDRFDENYGLACTQSLKNKDIPEGGAKGTILPSCVFLLFILGISQVLTIASWLSRITASPRLCFEKYVDVGFSHKDHVSTMLMNGTCRLSLICLSPGKVLASRSVWSTCMGSRSCYSLVLMVRFHSLRCFVSWTHREPAFVEGTADMMDWAACRPSFLFLHLRLTLTGLGVCKL